MFSKGLNLKSISSILLQESNGERSMDLILLLLNDNTLNLSHFARGDKSTDSR